MRTKGSIKLFLFVIVCIFISRDSVKIARCNISVTEVCRGKLISAYHNGVDVLDAYLAGEEYFRKIIEEKIGEAEFKNIDVQFCHFNDNLNNMTAEFNYDGKNYCLLMYNGEVRGLDKIEVKDD